jgi:hypothetical protein
MSFIAFFKYVLDNLFAARKDYHPLSNPTNVKTRATLK